MLSKNLGYKDKHWMRHALALAQQAADLDEVPVGAVIVADDQIIGEGFNQPISTNNPTAHAEIIALQNAALFLKNYRLPNTRLYVTLEPCTMCVGAMVHARIDTVIYGATEPKAGALKSQLQLSEQDFFNHQLNVVADVLDEPCGQILSDFFKRKRQAKKALK